VTDAVSPVTDGVRTVTVPTVMDNVSAVTVGESTVRDGVPAVIDGVSTVTWRLCSDRRRI